MGIGASVFLIAVGAILTFALHVHVGGVDVQTIGWILMAAGALGLIVTLLVWSGRRRRTVVEDPTGYRRVEEYTDTAPPDLR